MATKKMVKTQVGEMRHLIQGVAKNFVERVYGPQGPAWGTQFADLEELTVQIGQAVSQEMLLQALTRQAAEPVPAADEACPTCQRPGTPGEPEARVVTTRSGTAEWLEPSRQCPRCRRAFFPSVETFGN